MTGFNHATTGALIAAATGNVFLAVPIAFLSHFALDAIPHFGWDFDKDVFERNRSKEFRVGIAFEFPLSVAAIIVFPIILQSIVPWWVTLLSIAAAMMMDLVWIYRGVGEVITKRVKPHNRVMDFHIDISHHHQNFLLGVLWELLYFSGALLLIVWLIHRG